MAFRKTISANNTELRIAEELEPKVLPVTPDWFLYEPNEYDDAGAEIRKAVRNPITKDRQRRKGTTVGLSASMGFQSDLTSNNLQRILQGFLFADIRDKADLVATAVTADGYTVPAGGAAYLEGDLLFAEGAAAAINNGFKVVGAGSTGTNVARTGLTVAGSQTINLSRAGHQFASGDAAIVAPVGDFPRISFTAFDPLTLGLTPGEFIYIGGDTAPTRFALATSNGWARVKSVTGDVIVLDKTDLPMVADAGAGKTIQIFFGNVLKNEVGTLIKRRTYQIERSLGAPDTDFPGDEQAEYYLGSVASELTITVPEEDKITVDLTFMAQDYEPVTADEGLKAGNRPGNVETDAFDSSNSVRRVRMAVYGDEGESAPVPIFALIRELELTINNTLKENKAIGYLGSAEITYGTFMVDGEFTAYFATVEGPMAVRENADVTFDMAMWLDNRGVVIDLPMLTLGNGRLEVEQDESITLPLETQASTGRKYDANMDHTVLFTFFPYLPDAASERVDN